MKGTQLNLGNHQTPGQAPCDMQIAHLASDPPTCHPRDLVLDFADYKWARCELCVIQVATITEDGVS